MEFLLQTSELPGSSIHRHSSTDFKTQLEDDWCDADADVRHETILGLCVL